MRRPSVAALLTVHNRRELTLACLRSVTRQSVPADVDIFLVDDASTDGTAAAVAQEFPTVFLIEGDGSLYWNGGMRRAFRAALAKGYDYYWWLNDDTHLDGEALRTLLSTAERIAEPAIVAGTTRDPLTGRPTYGGVARLDSKRPLRFALVEPLPRDPRRCETMNGNCVLIPKQVAHVVGNIDRRYVQKMGDFDYGLRARQEGFEVWVAPGTVGVCAQHAERRTDERPLMEELRRLGSTKELPPRAWSLFTRRWAGPLWPVYWMSPYLRRGLSLLVERLNPKA